MKSSPARGFEEREVEKRGNFIPSPASNLLPGRKVASERKKRKMKIWEWEVSICENSRIDRFQAAAAWPDSKRVKNRSQLPRRAREISTHCRFDSREFVVPSLKFRVCACKRLSITLSQLFVIVSRRTTCYPIYFFQRNCARSFFPRFIFPGNFFSLSN